MRTLNQQQNERWHIFICYRQEDGREYAEFVYGALKNAILPFTPDGMTAPPVLSLYFDQASPAVSDWTIVHGHALSEAHTIVIVCTPGLHSQFGADDWVHKELDWWLSNRQAAPVIIQTHSDKWIPQKVLARWPNAQRISVDQQALLGDEENREFLRSRIRDRIIGGIQESAIATLNEAIHREQQRTQTLVVQRRRLKASLATMVVLLLGLVATAVRLAHQGDELSNTNARLSADAARQYMRVGENALQRQDANGAIGAFLDVLSVAPRNDEIRTAAISGVINEMPEMPKMLGSVGAVAAATFSEAGDVVVGRRPNGDIFTWNITLRRFEPSPSLDRQLSAFERINFLTSPLVSRDGHWGAVVVPIDIDLGPRISRPERWRVVVWKLGTRDLTLAREYADTRPSIQWIAQNFLLINSSYPKDGHQECHIWLPARSTVEPFRFDGYCMSPRVSSSGSLDRAVVVIEKRSNGSRIIQYVNLDGFIALSSSRENVLPADAIVWSTVAPLAGEIQLATNGSIYIEAEPRLICNSEGCRQAEPKPQERAVVGDETHRWAGSTVAEKRVSAGLELVLATSGYLLAFPSRPLADQRIMSPGTPEDLLDQSLPFAMGDHRFIASTRTGTAAVEVRLLVLDSGVEIWRQTLPLIASRGHWAELEATEGGAALRVALFDGEEEWLLSTSDGRILTRSRPQRTNHTMRIVERTYSKRGSLDVVVYHDGSNSGLLLGQFENGNIKRICDDRFDGFRGLSGDGDFFLNDVPDGFEVRSTKGPSCQRRALLQVGPGNLSAGIIDEWRTREIIGVLFRKANHILPEPTGAEFIFDAGMRWQVRARGPGSEILRDGRSFELPRLGPGQSGYLNYFDLSDNSTRLITIDPYSDIYQPRCIRVWALVGDRSFQVLGPRCVYVLGREIGMFTVAGDEYVMSIRRGVARFYLGPRRPAEWKWANRELFGAVMGFWLHDEDVIVPVVSDTVNAMNHFRLEVADDGRDLSGVAAQALKALDSWAGGDTSD